MNEHSESRKINWWRVTGWTLGVIAAIAVVAFVVFFVWLENALSPKQDPPMKPGQITALENDLRSKGSAEDALVRYETALQQMADDVAALVPGLKWHWNRESTTVSCPAPLSLAERSEFTVIPEERRHTNHFPGGPQSPVGLPAICPDLRSPTEQVSTQPSAVLVRGACEEMTQRIAICSPIGRLPLAFRVRKPRRHFAPPRIEGSVT